MAFETNSFRDWWAALEIGGVRDQWPQRLVALETGGVRDWWPAIETSGVRDWWPQRLVALETGGVRSWWAVALLLSLYMELCWIGAISFVVCCCQLPDGYCLRFTVWL